MGLGVTVIGQTDGGPRGGVGEEAVPQVPRKTVTILKACVIAGVTRRTIYNWMEKGKLAWVVTPGGGRRIYEDCLLREPGV